MRLWTLSAKEIDRLEIIQLVIARRLSVTKAADRIGIGRQRMSQLVNAYRRDGAVTLASGKRDKPANNKYSEELGQQSCNLVREHYKLNLKIIFLILNVSIRGEFNGSMQHFNL